MKVSSYRKLFDPAQPAREAIQPDETVADRAPPHTYLFDDALVLAVNIALATRRPLLLRGPSGVGKSALAQAVAWHQGWSFVPLTVTSRTLARDLLYRVDELRRLQDAYAQRSIDDLARYLVPGPLYWAFDPAGALALLMNTDREHLVPPGIRSHAERAVVLIDEIDKAEPDVPNNLLEPLGRLAFQGDELASPVTANANNAPFIVLTTNEERDLPDAFLRRCMEHRIEAPSQERLREIGTSHFRDLDPRHHEIVAALEPASPAEYLDALRACRQLVTEGSAAADLQEIAQFVLKPGRAG